MIVSSQLFEVFLECTTKCWLRSRAENYAPPGAPCGKAGTRPRRVQLPSAGSIIAFPEVGGLHHRYERRSA